MTVKNSFLYSIFFFLGSLSAQQCERIIITDDKGRECEVHITPLQNEEKVENTEKNAKKKKEYSTGLLAVHALWAVTQMALNIDNLVGICREFNLFDSVLKYYKTPSFMPKAQNREKALMRLVAIYLINHALGRLRLSANNDNRTIHDDEENIWGKIKKGVVCINVLEYVVNGITDVIYQDDLAKVVWLGLLGAMNGEDLMYNGCYLKEICEELYKKVKRDKKDDNKE